MKGDTSTPMKRLTLITILLTTTLFSFSYTQSTHARAETVKIAAPTETYKGFGAAVAIDGDVAVIGSPDSTHCQGIDSVQDVRGSAHMYRLTNDVWTLEETVDGGCPAGSNTGFVPPTYFGAAVAVAGDMAAVSARGTDGFKGAVNLYRYTNNRWQLEQSITPADAQNGDNFGWDVAMDGNTLIVGAPGATAPTDISSGAVYVYTRTDNTWAFTQRLTVDDPANGDFFGGSLDLNGNTLIASAYNKNNESGAAYTFIRDGGGTWAQQDKLLLNTAIASDRFGWDVALSGDHAVISKQGSSGRTYFFTNDGNGDWTQQQELFIGTGVDIENNVAVIQDRDGDEVREYTLGTNNTWTQTDWFDAADIGTNDGFGNAVATSNGTVIVGSRNNAGSGAVYIYEPFNNPLPYVLETTPANDAVLVAEDSNITITFSRAVQTSGNWFTLTCQQTNTTYTVSNATITGTGDTRTVDLLTDLPANDTCTMTLTASQITADSNQLDGNDDGVAGDDYTFIFSTLNRGIDLGNGVTRLTTGDDWIGDTLALSGDIAAIKSLPDENNGLFAINIFENMNGNWVQTGRFDGLGGTLGLLDSVDVDGTKVAAIDYTFPNEVGVRVYEKDNAGDWYEQAFIPIDLDPLAPVEIEDNNIVVRASDSVYVFTQSQDGNWTQEAELTLGQGTSGRGLALSYPNVMFTRSNTPETYVFKRATSGDWSLVDELAVGSGTVRLNGDTAAFASFPNPISIYRQVTDTSWTEEATIPFPDPNQNNLNNQKFDLAENKLIVGAQSDDNANGEDAGAAYVYQRDEQGSWMLRAKLLAPDGLPNDSFGFDVSIDQNRALISSIASYSDETGAAYIFEISDFAPALQQTIPASGATNIAPNANINLVFNEPVTTSANAIALTCNSTPQVFTLLGSGTNYAIDPTTDLPPNANCTVTVDTNAVQDADSDDPPDTLLDTDGTNDGFYTLTFTVADTPPTLVSSIPANGTTGVTPTAAITLNFSEAVNVNAAGITLNCNGNIPFALTGNGTRYTLTPSAPLPVNSLCAVAIPAATVTDTDTFDPPDTLLETDLTDDDVQTFSFSTRAEAGCEVNFNANGTCGYWFINIGGDNLITANDGTNWFPEGNDEPWSSTNAGTRRSNNLTNFTYTGNVNENHVPRAVFQTYAEDNNFSFSLDTNYPNGSSGGNNIYNVTVYLADRNNDSTRRDMNITIEGTQLAADYHPRNDTNCGGPNRFCAITFQRITVTDGFLDIAFERASNRAIRVNALEVSPADVPRIDTTSPLAGATDVTIDTPITLTFTEPVTVDSTAITLICERSGNIAFTGSGTGATYTLTPTTTLPNNQPCTVTIPTASVTDLNGSPALNPLFDDDGTPDNRYVFSFTTIAGIAPRVLSTVPQLNATEVPPNTNIQVTFSEEIRTTDTGVTFICQPGNVTYTLQVLRNGNTYTGIPNAPLPLDATCKLRLPSTTIVDTNDNLLVDDDGTPNNAYELTFTTQQSPQITSITPANNASNQPANTRIVVTFSEEIAVNPAFTTGITFICQPGNVTFGLQITSDGNTYTATPNTPLPENATCTLSIPTQRIVDTDGNALLDTDGNPNGTYTLQFTTAPVPPRIVDFRPANGATNISPQANLVATISEPFQLGQGVVSFVCQPTGAQFRFNVTINGNIITADPIGDLPANSTCTLSLGTSMIQDLAGNNFVDDDGTNNGVYTVQFNTSGATGANQESAPQPASPPLIESGTITIPPDQQD